MLPWVQTKYPDMNVVFQQDGASKKAQKLLEDNLSFWPKKILHPFSPDANPLDFTFWVHVESMACTLRHPNINNLKDTVNQYWDLMSEDYIHNGCKAFRVAWKPSLLPRGDTSIIRVTKTSY
uniref:Uncharacterized protein n=1 Tax=Lepeophtheirus salmonis TaxID=72036 RepID=A0A0K2UFA4_LEPSM